MLPLGVPELHLLFEDVHTFVKDLFDKGTYVALFSLLVACGMGLPLPEDIPLFTAGVLMAKGHMDPWATPLVAWLGIMMGDTALYCIAATLGPKIISFPVVGRHLTQKRLDFMHKWFEKYGIWAVGFGRMLTGVRGAMVAVAGIIGFNYATFIFVDAIAAVISGGAFLGLGYYVGKNGAKFKDHAWRLQQQFGVSFFSSVLLLALIVALVLSVRARHQKKGTPAKGSEAAKP